MLRGNSTLTVLSLLVLFGSIGNTGRVHADATLVYRIVDADGSASQYTFAIRGRFVRVDRDVEPDRYRLFDTGMMTMLDVDQPGKRYAYYKYGRGGPAAAMPYVKKKPSGTSEDRQGGGQGNVSVPVLSPNPVLKPSREKRNVAGVLCRIVNELVEKQVVAEHCMAGTGPLTITSREMTTLARLFTIARRLEFGWPGVATADERIASIDSKAGAGNAAQTLVSISKDWLGYEYMRIPKTYRKVDSLENNTPVQEQPESGELSS